MKSHQMVVRCASGVLALGLMNVAFGGTWQAVDGNWNGSFTADAHWSGGRAADGGTDTIDAASSPNGIAVTADGAATRAQLLLKAQVDKPVTFDAIGSSFLMPAQTQPGVTWPMGPFSAYLNGKSAMIVSTGGADWTRFHTQGAFQLTDASVKVWSPEPGVAEVWIANGTAGTFNAYDPNGIVTKASNGALPCTEFFSDSYFKTALPTVRFRCTGGVNTKLPSATFHPAGTTEILLEGGTHKAFGNLQLNSPTNRVLLTNGASLDFGSNGGDVSLPAYSRSVFSGGTIACRLKPGARSTLVLTNCAVEARALSGDASARIALQDVTLCGSGGSISTVSAVVTESRLGDNYVFNLTGTDGTYVFTNLTGQTANDANGFKIANAQDSNCSVVFAGEKTQVMARTNGHGLLGAGNGSTGTMTLEDGTFEFRPTGTANRFNLAGGGATATGVLNIRGGTFISKVCQDGSTTQFGLGITQGTGFINVSGGTVDVSGLCICTEDSGNTEESVFRQTGGLVKITAIANDPGSGQSRGLWATGNGKTTRKARIALDGGVTEVNAVGGGSSAQCRGGTGWAAFEADGGTIRANGDSTFLLSHFDEATLGAKGLTVDSNGHAVQISQNLAKKAGVEAAVLTLAGTGTKVINGANTVGIAATGGFVGFSCSSDNRGVDLVVAPGAGMYCGQGGDGYNRMFKSLTVGGVQGSAYLTYYSGEPLVVSGPVTMTRVRLHLEGSYAAGSDYVLVRTSEEPDAVTKAAWMSAVSEGLAGGLAADFTVSGNATDGWEFKMSVRTQQDREITVDAGITSNVTEDVVFAANETLTADVGAGGALTVGGAIVGGSLVKTGTGRMEVSSPDTRLAVGITVSGGILQFPLLAALTDPMAADVLLTLTAGTLQLGEAGQLMPSVRVLTPAANDAVAVKCDADVTMNAPSTTRGCFVKRGTGTLTLVSGGTTALSSEAGKDSKNNMPPADPLAFGNDGAVPNANYSALTVAEGDLVLKGASPASAYTMGGSGAVYVGMPVPLTQKAARLIVDGVKASFLGNHFHVGSGVRSSNNGTPETALVVTNGAVAEVTSLRIGWNSNMQGKPRVRIAGDGSCLYVKEYLYAADSYFADQTEADPLVAVTDGARLWLPALTDGNPNHALVFSSAAAVLSFDNGRLSALDDLPGRVRAYQNRAKLFFRNGSVCCVSEVRVENDTSDITFTFDDSEWTFGTAEALTLQRPERITVTAENAGLILSAAAAETRTFPLPVSGTGGLVKRGAGKVALSATPTFTGVCKVEDGELAFAGVVPEGLRFAGAGAVADSTLKNASIVLDLDESGVPQSTLTLKNVDLTGLTKVEMPAEIAATKPKDVVVATFIGAAPDVSTWRLARNGSGMSGDFRVQDGKVLMDVDKKGILLIVR